MWRAAPICSILNRSRPLVGTPVGTNGRGMTVRLRSPPLASEDVRSRVPPSQHMRCWMMPPGPQLSPIQWCLSRSVPPMIGLEHPFFSRKGSLVPPKLFSTMEEVGQTTTRKAHETSDNGNARMHHTVACRNLLLATSPRSSPKEARIRTRVSVL